MRQEQLQPKTARAAATLAIGIAVGLAAMAMPHVALAASASAGGGLPYESFLTNITKSISGPVAYAFSLGGVFAGGGTLIFGGDLNGFVRILILLVCFCALLISAPAVLSSISGAGAVVAMAAPPLFGGLA